MARRALPAVVLSALAMLLAACSSSDSSDEESKETDASGPELTVQLPAATGDIDVLNWAVPTGEPPQLDPKNGASQSMALVDAQLCDPLVRAHADYSYEPNLVSYEQVDPLTLELTLVADAKFWNGNPVTTEDIAYSMNRTMDPSAVYSFYYTNVKSVEATDDKTVTVKFTQPDELFIKEMSGSAGMVVEKAFAEKQGKKFGTAGGELMCSGPYKLGEWKPGQSITLERNDDYWNPDYMAHAKTVNLRFLTDSTALSQALESGEVDGSYEVPTALIPSLSESENGKVYFGDGPLSYFIGWAHPGAPLDDVKLRKAIYIATDREALAEKVFNGAGKAANTLIWEGTWDFDAKEQWAEAAKPFAETNAYDLEAAKKLVEESSYNGEKLVMTTQAGDETMSLVAQYIQEQAKQIGVTIEINPVQAVDYSTQTYDAAARKGSDILIGPSYNGYPDPIEGIGYIFEPGGPYNWTDYKNDEVSDLLSQAIGEFDTEKRVDLLTQAQTIYEPDYPEVTLVSLYEVSYLKDGLTGLVTTTAGTRLPSLALIGTK